MKYWPVMIALMTVMASAARSADVVSGEKATDNARKPWWVEFLTLRDSLAPDAEGARFSAVRSAGKTDYQVDAALAFSSGNRLLPTALQKAGWLWEIAAEVHRNTSDKEPAKSFGAQIGAAGTIPLGAVTALNNTALRWDRDSLAQTRAVGLRSTNTLLFDPPVLDQGIPYSREMSARFVFPFLGLHVDRLHKPTESTTHYGASIGVRAEYYPGRSLWPVKLSASGLRAKDLGGASDRRSSTFYRIGMEYAFIDPHEPGDHAVVPTLSLERTLGSNFLVGLTEVAKTSLVFRLSLN